MWNPLNRAPKGPEGPKLQSTSDEVLELLIERARQVAETAGTSGDRISEADIKHAAFRAALAAERAGHPYTAAELNTQDTDMQLVDAFGERLKARPDTSMLITDNSGGVIGTAEDKAGAMGTIQKEREGA